MTLTPTLRPAIDSVDGGTKPKRRWSTFAGRAFPFVLLSPAMLLTLVILVFALLLLVNVSLRSIGLATLAQMFSSVLTISNYTRILGDPATWNSLSVTLRYVLFGSAGSFALGLATALLLNERLPAQRLLRTLMLVPWAVPGITATIAFLWLLQPSFGLVNYVLRSAGFITEDVNWFGSPTTALGAVIIPTIWKSYPFFTVTLLAALQSVPKELYEAASIDGAGSWQRFRHVTLPSIRLTAVIALVFNAMHMFREFDFIFASTRGGPSGATDTLAIRIYNMAFQAFDTSGAAALGVLTFLFVAAATLFYLRWQNKQGT